MDPSAKIMLHCHYQVEETAKRATKPNRAFQARSSLELDRFDHQIEICFTIFSEIYF